MLSEAFPLKALTINHAAYSICLYREQDIMLVKDWRNQQMEALRQDRVLTEQDQLNYYHNVVMPTFQQAQPKIILFSYLRENQCIGYGGLTNIHWHDKRAELSFLVNTDRTKHPETYTADFSTFIKLMMHVAFEQLNLNRIFTETYNIRPLHIAILEATEMHYEGAMKQHVLINNQFEDSLIHGHVRDYARKY